VRAIALILALAACGRQDTHVTVERKLAVGIDRRVELMSIVFRLAGLPRYTEAATPYARAVDAHFAPFREHDAVVFSRQLPGIGYEMAPALAVFLDDNLAPLVPLAPLPHELARWQVAKLDVYLAAVRAFAKAADVDGFLAAQRASTDAVVARDRAFFDKVPAIEWLDHTFGPRPGASYHLVAGLLTGPMDYAARRGDDIYVIAHLDTPDEAGLPSPRATAVPFVIHELCHSYTNPIVDAAMGELQPRAARAIGERRELFQRQAYTTDQIVLEESVVRAVVVLWVRDRDGSAAAQNEIATQERLGFAWTGALADALDQVRARGPLDAAAIVAATRSAFNH
jgi:hypothetical protein